MVEGEKKERKITVYTLSQKRKGRKEKREEERQTHNNIDRLVQIHHDPLIIDDRNRTDPLLRKHMNDVEHRRLKRRCCYRPVRLSWTSWTFGFRRDVGSDVARSERKGEGGGDGALKGISVVC